MLSGGTRVYYLDGYEDHNGRPLAVLTEVPTREKAKRKKVFLYPEVAKALHKSLGEFIESLDKN